MIERRGINSSYVKNRNRGLVLRLICCNSPVSRIEIAKLTGLSKMTVTNIISELIESGYVAETHIAESGSVGRNRIELDIAPTAPKVIGIYISRKEICSVLTDLKLRIICRYTVPLDGETSTSLKEKVIISAHRMLDSAKTSDTVLGIGVSSIGPLDNEKGILLNPPNFFGLRNFNIVSVLQKEFDLPVILNNDMNASALAEQLFGNTSRCQDFLYLGIADGVGAGIITRGNLFHNGSGLVGELGHMSIKFDGAVCHCGSRGCLELYASMSTLLAQLKTIANKNVTVQDLERLSNNPRYAIAFEDLTKYLATALTNAVNILSPDCIVIGHDGAYLPKKQLALLENSINNQILASGHINVKVFPASFGNLSPLFGSSCLIVKQLFDGKLA